MPRRGSERTFSLWDLEDHSEERARDIAGRRSPELCEGFFDIQRTERSPTISQESLSYKVYHSGFQV